MSVKESIGATKALAFVMFFIAIISGYLAFTINYSKAFKVKSRIIDIIQAHDNNIEDESERNAIKTEVWNYIQSVGYSSSNSYLVHCGDDFPEVVNNQGWCYKVYKSRKTSKGTDNQKRIESETKYVMVKTFVTIDVPVFNKVFPSIRYFHVEGSTSPTTKRCAAPLSTTVCN